MVSAMLSRVPMKGSVAGVGSGGDDGDGDGGDAAQLERKRKFIVHSC